MNLDTQSMTLEQAKAAIWQLQRGAHRDATTIDAYYETISRHQVTNAQLQQEVQRLSRDLVADRNLRASQNPIDLETTEHGRSPAAHSAPRASVAAPSIERLQVKNEEQAKNERRLQAKNEELRHQAISLKQDQSKAWKKAEELNNRIVQLETEKVDLNEKAEKLEADLRTAKAAKIEPNLGRSLLGTPMSPRKNASPTEAAKMLLDVVHGDASKAVNLVYAQSRLRGFTANSTATPIGNGRPREHWPGPTGRVALFQDAAPLPQHNTPASHLDTPVAQHDTPISEHGARSPQQATIQKYKQEQIVHVDAPSSSNAQPLQGCEDSIHPTVGEKRVQRMRKDAAYRTGKRSAFAVDLTSDDDTEQPKKKARQTQATSPNSEIISQRTVSRKIPHRPSANHTARTSISGGHTRQFLGILRELEGCRSYKEFILPVDPEADECPDYPEVIDRPCDLQTIRRKLDNHEYHTLEAVNADFKLIVSNATTYNPPEHETYQNALRFEKEYRRLLDLAGYMHLSRSVGMGNGRRRAWMYELPADMYD